MGLISAILGLQTARLPIHGREAFTSEAQIGYMPTVVVVATVRVVVCVAWRGSRCSPASTLPITTNDKVSTIGSKSILCDDWIRMQPALHFHLFYIDVRGGRGLRSRIFTPRHGSWFIWLTVIANDILNNTSVECRVIRYFYQKLIYMCKFSWAISLYSLRLDSMKYHFNLYHHLS